MTTISSDVNTFIANENKNRGTGGIALDFNVLTGPSPAGDNSVTGISGVSAGASAISLGSGYNAVILDGTHSTNASVSGAHSYSFNVQANGQINILDNNSGLTVNVTGANYLVFNGGATNTGGSYQSIFFIEGSTNAEIAAMYQAAFQRQPDLPGLEFYAKPIAAGTMTLHQAATYILGSPEFTADYPTLQAASDGGGPNDQAFIKQLYGQILHRTPTADEVNFYVQDLQGKLSGQTTPDDRPQLLEYFALSPENQKAISSFIINTNNGPYADSSDLLPAQTTLSQEVASGTVDASQFAAPTSSTNVVVTTAAGTTSLYGQGFLIGNGHIISNSLGTTVPGLTIELSSTINSASIFGANDTVYGASGGNSTVTLPSYGDFLSAGGSVHLSGTGNTLYAGGATSGAVTPVTIYGFTAGDAFKTLTAPAPFPPGYTNLLLTGSASSPIQGSSYLFVGNGINAAPGQTGIATLIINVGNVNSDSAADMAAAANAVYKVGDLTNENITFIGQDPSGNTAVWHWGNGDVNNTHRVDANAFTGAEILVGVAPSAITVSMFH